jgi:hypothetical protein
VSWSYNESNLGTKTASERLNSVRLLVGDTDAIDQQVQDEEITFALSQTGGSIYYAAAWVARTLASKYSRLVDTDLDGILSESYSQLQVHYRNLATELEFQGKKSGATLGVAAGGVSRANMKAVEDNTDRVKPRIRRDQFLHDSGYIGDYE